MSIVSRAFSTIAAVLVVATAVTSPARAENGGVHHGAMCSGSGLTTSISGLSNPLTYSMYATCPTVRDEVYSTHGLNRAYVFYYLQANTGMGCSISSLSQTARTMYYQYQYTSTTAFKYGYLTFNPIGGVSSGSYAFTCYMPPGAGITSYRIDEWS